MRSYNILIVLFILSILVLAENFFSLIVYSIALPFVDIDTLLINISNYLIESYFYFKLGFLILIFSFSVFSKKVQKDKEEVESSLDLE